MVEEFTAEQIEEFREAFALFDMDDDGKITANELGVVMRSLGKAAPTDAELKDLCNDVGLNGDGTMDFDEFLPIMAKHLNSKDKNQDIIEAFRIFDRDQNGFVSPEELRLVMANMGEHFTEEEVQEMIREVDLDGDGQLNFEEFVLLISK